MRPTVCLNMIVKDEAHVIRRCLDSVRPFIDAWVIVDTGSIDGTQAIIRGHLADLPGALHERPWKDFGHNRTEALALARDRGDYTLVIDADEVLEAEPGFALPPLTADAYQTRHLAGDSGTSFYLTHIVRSALPWRYEGVLHEVITCDREHTSARIDGISVKGLFDSARNRDPRRKYLDDAATLEAALEDDPHNARYVFYLAQSYRDAGEIEKGIEAYEMRVVMGGWPEEVWYSLYQIAVLRERLGGDFAPALAAYLRAYQYRPARAEPLCQLARHYREMEEYALAYLFARQAAAIPRPADILFLDDSVYEWRALDEAAIAAYYCGAVEEALAANDRLLAGGALPESQRGRVEANRAYCVAALGKTEDRDAGPG